MAAPSLAKHYRAHREAFTLALELGITPREAEAEIRKRQARLRWLAAEQRREARSAAPVHQSLDFARDERAGVECDQQPWMMRE